MAKITRKGDRQGCIFSDLIRFSIFSQMPLLNKSIDLIKKPFPQEESRLQYFKIIGSVCVFVVLFLYIFRPFGLNTLESDVFLICLGFGISGFVACIIYEIIVIGLFKVKGDGVHFTFGKWIIYIIGLVLVISIANFLFARIVIFGYIQWDLLPYMIRGTFATGIIPVLALGALALMKQERKYQNIADQINEKRLSHLEERVEDEPSLFDIPVSQIRYMEALQNYVKIGFVDREGRSSQITKRATLKGILDILNHDSIVKCHRSFLVNHSAISSTSGNAQGLLLTLSDCDKKIPVSRSFVSQFR